MRNYFIIFLFLQLTISSHFANDAVYRNSGNGSDVFPVNSSNIKMVSEKINITFLDRYFWKVEMDGLFQNIGPSEELQIGFPIDKIYAPIGTNSETTENIDFKTIVDGKEYEITKKNGIINQDLYFINYPDVYTFAVNFVEGEIKNIKHSFTIPSNIHNDGSIFKYILRTGALWKDSINKIEIMMTISIEDIQDIDSIFPFEHKSYVESDSVKLIWNYENIDPHFNFEVFRIPEIYRNVTLERLISNQDKILEIHGALSKYLKNTTFAHYGYPFKNPFINAQFYHSGKYSLNENYSWKMINPNHQIFIDDMLLIEKSLEKN